MQIQRKPDPNQVILVARLVWVAMLASVGALFFVAQMDEAKQTPPVSLSYAEIFSDQMIQMLFIQGVVLALAAFFLPKVIGKRGTGGDSKVSKGFVALVIRLALAEAVQIMGLVGALTLHTSMVMHPFSAISILLILISFPTQELLEDFAS